MRPRSAATPASPRASTVAPPIAAPSSANNAADASGATYGKVTLKTGLRQPAMESRAVVVTDFDGARVACATLGLTPVLEAAEFSGRRFVGGSLGPVPTENHKPVQTFAYALENGDPACAGGPDPAAAHACGLRIHKGESCREEFGELAHATEDARGRRLTRDPWAGLVYAPGADRRATLRDVYRFDCVCARCGGLCGTGPRRLRRNCPQMWIGYPLYLIHI